MGYNDQKAARIFTQQLAPLLGYRFHEDLEMNGFYEMIRDSDSFTLMVDPRMCGKGRVEIRPRLPRNTPTGEYVGWHSDKTPTITVALSRKPEAVALDIQRRLLADAEQAFVAAKARIADRIGQTYVTRTVCAQLGIVPNNKSNVGSRWLDIGGPGSASIEVQDGGHVKIEIRSIPVALALQVVAVLEAAVKAAESEG